MQLSDDQRFQNLPPEEVRKIIQDLIQEANWKYVFIDHVSWYNMKTRCKHDVTNMPIIAYNNSSSRPIAVTDVSLFQINTSEDGRQYNTKIGQWCYNRDYVHVNITTEINTNTYKNDKYKLFIQGHEICNPITQGHFFQSKSLEELKLLFIGQLMGQNNGSPFRTIASVAGTYEDYTIKTTTGQFIKLLAPIIQLLTRCASDILQNKARLLNTIASKTDIFPQKDNEVAYKAINKDHYDIGTLEEVETIKDKKLLSAYYPIITAEMCKNIIDNLPKIEIDFGCFGLGSAGSGVLDMLSRSIFFDKYMLVDFDRVESKNVRNQWYNTSQINQYKTQASEYHLKYRNVDTHNREIISKTCVFQEIKLNIYSFKYAMAAFDTIQTRLDFLNTMLEEPGQCKFLFDARYDDLTASIFFIDLENKDEVEYYRQGLLSDLEAFKKQHAKRAVNSWEKFYDWLISKNTFDSHCTEIKRFLQTNLKVIYSDIICPPLSTVSSNKTCGNTECLDMWRNLYEKYKDAIAENITFPEEESSCIKQNFIDIYHYASTYIFDAIKAMEADTPTKLFTHIDVTTDPLPNAIILRK